MRPSFLNGVIRKLTLMVAVEAMLLDRLHTTRPLQQPQADPDEGSSSEEVRAQDQEAV